jgi:hypothetical protein
MATLREPLSDGTFVPPKVTGVLLGRGVYSRYLYKHTTADCCVEDGVQLGRVVEGANSE